MNLETNIHDKQHGALSKEANKQQTPKIKLQSIQHIAGKHYLIILYSIIVFCLLIGLMQGYNLNYSWYVIGLYAAPMLLFYAVLYKLLNRKLGIITSLAARLDRFQHKINHQHVSWALIIWILTLIISHGIIIQGFPGFIALWEFDYEVLINLRKQVTLDFPVSYAYFYSFTLRAIVPFSLVYVYLKGNRAQLYILCLMAFVIALNGMQKSQFLSFFLPLCIILFGTKKYKQGVGVFAGIALSIVLMVFITNPTLKYSVANKFVDVEYTLQNEQLDEEVLEQLEQMSVQNANKTAVNSIILRTVYLPGEMVGKWFDAIPAEKPFLRGKGYRLYTAVTGEPFHDYSLELYPYLYPEYAIRGYSGSVNVASFMYDYSNWGLAGLPLCAVIMAFIIVIINLSFGGDALLKIAFNTMPVLLLSSGNYTTILFSGGWGLIVLLYILLLKKSKHEPSR